MKLKILLFNTKTNGFPQYFKPAEEDLNNHPNVLQLAADLVEVDLDKINEPNYGNVNRLYNINCLIDPIRNEQSISIDNKVKHSITLKDCREKGDKIDTVSYIFQGLCTQADLLVSHNMIIERNAIASEMLRLDIKPKTKSGCKIFCTMKYGTRLLQLPGVKEGTFKFVTQEELYKHLFDVDIEEHFDITDANQSVTGTLRCLMELIRRQPNLKEWLENKRVHMY